MGLIARYPPHEKTNNFQRFPTRMGPRHSGGEGVGREGWGGCGERKGRVTKGKRVIWWRGRRKTSIWSGMPAKS
nr:MAG TPA: hypothetical protein [Caudoviricetes sp.]